MVGRSVGDGDILRDLEDPNYGGKEMSWVSDGEINADKKDRRKGVEERKGESRKE